MPKYAILDKNTNLVKNTVVIDDIDIKDFLLQNDEQLVLASMSVQIGMIYDENTKTFPEVYETDRFLELRYELNNTVNVRQNLLRKNGHLTEEQLTEQLNYLEQLQEGFLFNTYDDLKNHLDSLGNAPEIPPPPKVITQDLFRTVLTLSEKILWDNPQTGTSIQEATINTLKLEFPYYGIESMTEELDLLETIEFFTTQRVQEVKQALA